MQLKFVPEPEQVSQLPWHRALWPWQLNVVPEPTHWSQLPPQSPLFGWQLKALPPPSQVLQVPLQADSLGWQLKFVPEPAHVSQLPVHSALSATQSKVVPLPVHVEQVPAQEVTSASHVNVVPLPRQELQVPLQSDSSALQVPFEQVPQLPLPQAASSGRSSCSQLPETHVSSVHGFPSSHSAAPSQPMMHSPATHTPGTPSQASLSEMVSPTHPPSPFILSLVVQGLRSSQAPGPPGPGDPSNGSGMHVRMTPPDAGYSPATSQKGRSGSVHCPSPSQPSKGSVGLQAERDAIGRRNARRAGRMLDTVLGPAELSLPGVGREIVRAVGRLGADRRPAPAASGDWPTSSAPMSERLP